MAGVTNEEADKVLILIVMDNGLLLFVKKGGDRYAVLILIVMDNGLLQLVLLSVEVAESECLNPYCNG